MLLRCVPAESRTPTVAAMYGARVTGAVPLQALEHVRRALPNAHPNSALREVLTAGVCYGMSNRQGQLSLSRLPHAQRRGIKAAPGLRHRCFCRGGGLGKPLTFPTGRPPVQGGRADRLAGWLPMFRH